MTDLVRKIIFCQGSVFLITSQKKYEFVQKSAVWLKLLISSFSDQ